MAQPGHVQGTFAAAENKVCCEEVTGSHEGCWGDVRWVEANCNVCSSVFPFELVHTVFVVV